MLPDFAMKYLAGWVGNAVGGALWGGVATTAMTSTIAGAEFVSLVNGLRDGTATRADIAAVVTAAEASLLAGGLTLSSAGLLEGALVVGGAAVSAPLVAWLVAAAGIAVLYERNQVAIQDAAQVMTESIARGDQPWTFLPRMWDAYRAESFRRRISPDTNTNWRIATTPPRRDPLAIDLDGDGIETVGIPASGSPVLFDHDGDGVKTGTGWVKADDAWLVLDRNLNGLIDTGAELFGVDTLITVTEVPFGGSVAETVTRKANTGFEALATLDANHDGVFNASDAAFTQVRLWQDLNQDGISQSGELFSLADKGITAIGLTPSTTTTNLGNGNTVTGQASVTRSNGTSTQIDSVDPQAGNLTLADNPFYREFTDTIPLSAQARALPEMGGSGWLRDLREAMSLGTAKAASLTQLVSSFAATTTRDGQRADRPVNAWVRTTCLARREIATS